MEGEGANISLPELIQLTSLKQLSVGEEHLLSFQHTFLMPCLLVLMQMLVTQVIRCSSGTPPSPTGASLANAAV